MQQSTKTIGQEGLDQKLMLPQNEEQGQLGHSLSVLCTFSYNVPPDVTEAYNADNDANCQWHEASKDNPGNQESVTNWNNKVCLIVIR